MVAAEIVVRWVEPWAIFLFASVRVYQVSHPTKLFQVLHSKVQVSRGRGNMNEQDEEVSGVGSRKFSLLVVLG